MGDTTMVKCSGAESHEMVKGKKFCGTCGKPPAEAGDALVKCRACEGEFIKGANFCGDCGTATTAAEDLDSELERLGAFVKANAAKLDEYAGLPELDEDELGAAATETSTELVKASALKDDKGEIVRDAAGNPEINATPIITEMLKSIGVLGAQVRAYAEHGLGFQGHVAHGQDLLMKSVLAIGAAVKKLRDDIDTYGNGSRGGGQVRRPLALVDKTNPAGGAAADGAELRGKALFAKARAILGDEFEGLDVGEVSAFETFTNGMNGSMTELARERPILAQRITAALEAKKAS